MIRAYNPILQPLEPHAEKAVVDHIALLGIVIQEFLFNQRTDGLLDTAGRRQTMAEDEL